MKPAHLIPVTVIWIALPELPDDDRSVLTYAPNDEKPVWLGHYYREKWYDACGLGHVRNGITHWAELPAGPKQERAVATKIHVKTAAEMRLDAEHDTSCVGAFARARPGRKP